MAGARDYVTPGKQLAHHQVRTIERDTMNGPHTSRATFCRIYDKRLQAQVRVIKAQARLRLDRLSSLPETHLTDLAS